MCHVVALHDLSTTEAAQLGQVVTQVSQALHAVIDCVKTYSACFAEAEGFAHLHVHVIPRMEWFTAEQRGPDVFSFLGVSADEEVPEAERDQLALARARGESTPTSRHCERQSMTDNAERVREMLALADQMKVDELIEYFADDSVMELPFAPGRMEKRYEGKEAILGFQQFARDSFSTFSMIVDTIHTTADPHVVIAEHRSEGVVAANGRRYQNRYCTIFTFDDAGRVVRGASTTTPASVVQAFKR